MLNLLALLLAGVFIAGIAVAVGTSDFGYGVTAATGELQKLVPGYWDRAEARLEIQPINKILPPPPAWTADQLPKSVPVPRAIEPPPDASAEALDSLLDQGSGESNDLWKDSPSPLGRVGAGAFEQAAA